MLQWILTFTTPWIFCFVVNFHGSLTFTTLWMFFCVVNVTMDLNLYPPLDFLLGCNLHSPTLALTDIPPTTTQDPAHCISVPQIIGLPTSVLLPLSPICVQNTQSSSIATLLELLDPEDEGSVILQSVVNPFAKYTEFPRIPEYSAMLLCEHKI
jgi:hypothetical protein